MKRLAVVLLVVFGVSACGSESKTKSACQKIRTAKDIDAMRLAYTQALNDGIKSADIFNECTTLIQIVLDNGGTVSVP